MDEHTPRHYPLAYLITIRGYRTWLHGDDRGSIDRHGFNTYGDERRAPNPALKDYMIRQMNHSPMFFSKKERICVLNTIREVCDFRGYNLLAVNIRGNHLHAVVSADSNPEKITNEFKTYATRRLRKAGSVEKDKSVWARGKSNRYLWKQKHVETAVDYVLFGQGDAIPDFK